MVVRVSKRPVFESGDSPSASICGGLASLLLSSTEGSQNLYMRVVRVGRRKHQHTKQRAMRRDVERSLKMRKKKEERPLSP